jgi:hypothetical protein
MSEKRVYAAIAAVSGELAKIGIAKDSKNAQQGYVFRGIDSVYNALAPVLAKHGLVILPRILSRECVERTSKSGSAQFFVTVEAEFDFVAVADGSVHVVRTYGEAQDSADKATNKAMSAAYKYAAFQAFCIPTEGDNDADATTPEPVKAKVPTGYETWIGDMEVHAENGTAALQAAFKASKVEYRAHVTGHDSALWERIKQKAAKAHKPVAVPA